MSTRVTTFRDRGAALRTWALTILFAGGIVPSPAWSGPPGQDRTAAPEQPKDRIQDLAGPLLERLDRIDQLTHRREDQELAARLLEASCQQAKLAREAAERAVAEYEAVIFTQDVETREGELALANARLTRAQERLDWAKRMFARGLMNKNELTADEQDLLRAELDASRATIALRVLKESTRESQLAALRKAAERARLDERLQQSRLDSVHRNLAAIDRQLAQERLLPDEERMLGLLDEAIGLEESRAADRPHRDDPVRAKLDEAERCWSRAQVERGRLQGAEARRRIRRAVETRQGNRPGGSPADEKPARPR